jgi:hypothetical protein
MTKKSVEQSAKDSLATSQTGIAEQKVGEILARARQAVKPIINKEAANEIVSDDLLNFRMKAASARTQIE